VTAFTLNCDRETRSLEFAVFCVQLGVHRKTEKEIFFSFLFDLPSKSDLLWPSGPVKNYFSFIDK